MKENHDLLRAALSGLFDIQAEPEKVIVTAPGPLCNEFYRYLGERHPESRRMMFRPALEMGQEIHFNQSSTEQVSQWVHHFAEELDPTKVRACYRAIYP